jgi:hypothetical protein
MTHLHTFSASVNGASRRIRTGKVSHGEWHDRLPYGKWVCADGREVLFNRSYWPILERRPGEPAKPARSGEWVPWVEQHFFWDDYTHPGRRPETLSSVNRILTDWGFPTLPPPPKPRPSSGKLICAWELPDEIPPRINPWCHPFGAAPKDEDSER